MSRLWLQATQTCQLPTQIHKETSAAMFFGQNTSKTLGLNVYPTIISSSNKRCCHLKVKVIQGTVKQELQPEAQRHLSAGQFPERLLALPYTGTHVLHSGTQGPSWVMAQPPTF